MNKPWNKHSSTWDVPWEDRYENRKIVTVEHVDGRREEFRGNPAKILNEGKVVKVEDDTSAGYGAGLACLIFWGIALILFLNYTPGLFIK